MVNIPTKKVRKRKLEDGQKPNINSEIPTLTVRNPTQTVIISKCENCQNTHTNGQNAHHTVRNPTHMVRNPTHM